MFFFSAPQPPLLTPGTVPPARPGLVFFGRGFFLCRSQLFIAPFVIFRRDDNSATGNDKQEVEANRFGAALLMPATLLQKEIKKHGLDLDDEDALSFLAKRFRSAQPQ